VIPRAARRLLAIEPGQKMIATVVNGRIELVAFKPACFLREFLHSIDTGVDRDNTER
jgi:bifunctional DNA-binding transcriptional regulator/antitoxin component of YhaV-PrlF toxin-antitoxin module